MRILFVHNGYESLGIEYLSAALKRAGHETALVIDPCLFDEAGFWRSPALASLFSFRGGVLRKAEAFKPDLLAFSVFTDTWPWALALARELKARTGAKTVFGGIHPSSVPDAVLAEEAADFVCLGEGDLALPALAAHLVGDAPLPAGIWVKKDGAVIKGPPPAPPADLDMLPLPDKALFPAAAPVFSGGYLVSSSRGCPHSCAYCCNSVYRELYRASGVPCLRRRGAESVLKELEGLKAAPGFVHFTDEVFNSDYAWLERFLPAYRERVGLPFSCFVFPDARLAGLAPALAAAGCFKVQLGVQRFDERKRAELLGRRALNADIAAAIKALRAAGVYVTCDNILDLPDESEAELAGLAAFYAEHTPDHNEVFFLRLYPGTPLAERCAGLTDAPGGLMRPSGHSPLAPGRQRAWFSLLTLLPRLPAPLRLWAAARPGLFGLAGGLGLRALARLLSRPRRDFHTGRFLRLYAHFIFAKLKGHG
ncbi:MAG: cobalamin-dependent protein [Elusimicrobiales bacterium]|nr:cobalamin-dependent protein [Elusimicrobiales bacterium]